MMEFTFGTSIINTKQGEKPSAYDILSCVEKTLYNSFEDFCAYYGYDPDSRKAEKIYNACQKQAKEVNEIFSDVMEQLNEIW